MPYKPEELSGSLALAYGPHVVSGHIIKKTTEGTGESAQSYVVVWLGEGVWNKIRGAYYNGAEIPASDYHFHHGYLADSMNQAFILDGEWTQGVDPWNYGGIPYSGTAYVIVKLPQGVTSEDDLSDLKFVCECLRVPDFDAAGNQIDKNGVIVSTIDEPLVESAFFYSTNPALCIADLLLVRRGLSRRRIRWSAWHEWKEFCGFEIDWVGGEQAGRPAYDNITNVIQGVDGNVVKAYGSLAGWDGWVTTVSNIPAGQDGWFSVDPSAGTFLAGLAPISSNPDVPANVPLFLRFQANHFLYIQQGESILTMIPAGWNADDTFKIAVENGAYKLYKNDQPFRTDLTLPPVVGDQRGVAMFFDAQSEIMRAAFRPINSGRRTRPRFECGLAFPTQTDINAAMEAILLVSASDVQDADGELVFLPPTTEAAPRESVFDFNMSNITEGTFKTYRLSRDARPTKIPAKFRNVDVATLREDPADATRDELVDIIGHEQPFPEIYLGSMTKGQAECVLNYQIRIHSDLDLYCSFEADGTSWKVIPGDVATISHDVPGWSNELFMCIEATDLPSVEGEADRRRFLFQKFHPGTYSDTDHTPIQVNITPTIPNVLIGAPPIRSLVLNNESGFNANRVWQHQLRGIINFGLFPDAQKAWVYYSKASEGYATNYVINGSPFTPDANNAAEFTFTPLTPDTYRIRIVTANRYGTVDPTVPVYTQDIPIGSQPRTMTAPAAFTAQSTLDSIEFKITPPLTGLQQGDHYEVWASTSVNVPTNRVQADAAETWTEKFDDTTPSPMYRWVRVVDGMGNASALTPLNGGTGVTINRLTQVQNYNFTYDGHFLNHTFTPLTPASGVREYQIATDAAFSNIVASGPVQPITELPSGMTRTVTRYLRAMDFARNYSPVSGPITKTFAALGAPTLTLKESYPSSAAYSVVVPSNMRYGSDVKLIVQIATDTTFTNVIDEMTLDATTTRFVINGAASVRPTVYIRAYYLDAFGAGAFGFPTPSTYTFTKFSASDLQDAIINTASFAAGLKPVIIVTNRPTLPNATYPVDTVISVSSENGKLYRNIGNVWQAITATSFAELTGQITPATQIPTSGITNSLLAANSVTTANIVNNAIDYSKFASGLRPLETIAALPTLPNANYPTSAVVILSTDGRLYKNVANVWVDYLRAGDLIGTIAGSQLANGIIDYTKFAAGLRPIETVAALPTLPNTTYPANAYVVFSGRLYKNVANVWVDEIRAANLTGQITSTQITDDAITTPKIAANAVTANEIAANTITAAQIVAATITATQIAARTIVANNIAANTITANEIAVNTITANQIAANTITANQIAANTITAAKIAAGTITANELAANSVTANQIAAGAVTAQKLTIGNFSSMNSDPDPKDITAWTLTGGTAGSIVTINDGQVGRTALRSPVGGTSSYYSNMIPVDAARQYRIQGWARKNSTANGTFYLAALLFDKSGALISGDSTWWYHIANAQTLSTAWTQYVGVFGAGTTRTIPTNAAYVAVGVLVNGSGTVGYHEAQDLRLEEMIIGTVVANDAITTAKIAAGSITAEKLTVGILSDDLVTNGSFESYNITGIPDGWIRSHATPSGYVPGVWGVSSTYATSGTRSLLLNAPYQAAGSRAFPVVAGSTYSIRFKAYSPSAVGNWWLQINESTGDLTKPYLGYLGSSAPGYTQNLDTTLVQERDSATNLVANVTLASLNSGWTTYEVVYSVPVGVRFINIAFLCWNNVAAQLYVDEVEVRRQIRTVHMEDGAITAIKIAANTITAAQIAAGTITAAQIAADTITAGNIAAGAITASEIAAGAIQTTHLAANAITAIQIAAGAVTANAIAAGAITADLITAAAGDVGIVVTNQITSRDFSPHSPATAHAESLMWANKINLARTTIGGLQKTAGADNTWNAAAQSTRAIYKGDGYIEWTVPTVSTNSMIGLTWNPGTVSYTGLNAAWYMQANNTVTIYENGTYIGAYGAYVPGVTVLKIAIEGNNFVYYKDGVAQYTRSGLNSSGYSAYRNIQYPMRAGVVIYELNNITPPVSMYGIIGYALLSSPITTWATPPAGWTRRSDGDWNVGTISGWTAVQGNDRINTGDGYVEFRSPAVAASSQYWVAGLAPVGQDIQVGVSHQTNGLMYVYNPSIGFLSTGYTYQTTGVDTYRVGIEGTSIVARHIGQTPGFYTTTPTFSYPYAAVVETNRSNSIIPGNLSFGVFGTEGQGWKMHPTQGSASIGVIESNEGFMIRNIPLTEAVAKAASSFGSDWRYRGNDRGVVPVSEITWIDMWGYRRFFEESVVWARLYLNIDNYRSLTGQANADSIDHILVRVYNKFGDQIDFMYYPYTGRGVAYNGVHTRDHADPVEEAVYAFEIHNVYGYSRRVYFSTANWIGTTTPGWVNRGTVAPTWFQRSQNPTNATATAISDTSVALSWTPATGASSQAVYYRKYGDGGWTNAVVGLATGTTTYTINGLSANTRYEFMAHGSLGNSWSNTAMARTYPSPAAAAPSLASPTGLSASAASTTQINLNWTNGSGTASVEVWRNGSLLITLAAGTVTYSNTGLTASTTYTYKVRHNNGSITSAFSNEISQATLAAAPPPSTAPYNCVASATGQHTASVLFTNPGAAATVQWGTDEGSFPNSSASGVSSPYPVLGLASGTTYFFRVVNSSGTSNIASITTDPYIPPDIGPQCVIYDTPMYARIHDNVVRLAAREVKEGMIVRSINTVTGEAVWGRVKRVFDGQASRIYSIVAATGAMVQCSPSHPLITGLGDTKGVPSRMFRPGDSIFVYDMGRGMDSRVESVEYVDAETPVLTFEMENPEHTFVTGDIVSHNINNKS